MQRRNVSTGLKNIWLLFGLATAMGALLISQFAPPAAIQAAASLPGSASETLTGRLSIVWGDGQPGSDLSQNHYLLTRADGSDVALNFSAGLPVPYERMLRLRGQELDISGSWQPAASGSAAFNVVNFNAEQTPEIDAPLVSGAQPWVTLMCKFADIATEPKAPAFFQGMYSSSYPLLDHYWREQSYNTVNIAGSQAISQWVSLPKPRSSYISVDKNGNTEANLSLLATDCTTAADSVVNYAAYVGVNMMFNDNLDGYSWGGSHWITLEGVSRPWYMTWEPPWGYKDLTVIAHEMGHGFGLPHSHFKSGQTYDNRWDVMSDTWTDCSRLRDATYGCLGQQTIAYHKDFEGWLTGRTVTVNPGTRQTLSLEQLDLPQTQNWLLARVPISGTSQYYTVEARRNVGYDVKLPGQAVIIHLIDVSQSMPATLVNPGGSNSGDAGAQWLPGETFSDAAHGITIGVDSALETGFIVTISNALMTITPPTPTQTASPSRTATPSRTPTASQTATASRTPTPTLTSSPTLTPTVTSTPRPTLDPAVLTHHISLPLVVR